MNIRFSRHARRRARLYGISESVIVGILRRETLSQGEHEIIRDITKSTYPLKIVVSVKGDMITVVTNYPLKKRSKK